MATPIATSELPSPPFVAVEGVKNFRDIGGYPITGSDSKSVKRGFVYRSATLTGITNDGMKTLVSALGIRVIFDLRLQDEVDKFEIEKFPGVVAVHIPVPLDGYRLTLPEEIQSSHELREGNSTARW
jgi:Tyrosine phosphatase family